MDAISPGTRIVAKLITEAVFPARVHEPLAGLERRAQRPSKPFGWAVNDCSLPRAKRSTSTAAHTPCHSHLKKRTASQLKSAEYAPRTRSEVADGNPNCMARCSASTDAPRGNATQPKLIMLRV